VRIEADSACAKDRKYSIGMTYMLRFRPIPMMAAMLLALLLRNSNALQLNMMASSSKSDNLKKSILRTANFLPSPPGAADITSALISQLAVIAIKSRLKEERNVSCDVSFSSSDLLLRGRVGPVTVTGKDWRSGRGLTCRAIEATVEQCELDASKILSNRKLLLMTPALGKAMVALNSEDFGNFITHPLMKPPTAINGDTSSIDFINEGTHVDPVTASVVFFANYAGTRWKCVLQRSQMARRAAVSVSTTEEEVADQDSVANKLAEVLDRFFNELVFNLDGTFLSFRDMMVTDKGEAPSVMLALNIKVKKLPSPGLDF
jgi:hypothetical protein